MEKGITFAGLDAHKVAINVAMLLPDKALAVEWDQPNDTTTAAWTRRNKRTTTRLPRLDSSRSISAAELQSCKASSASTPCWAAP